MSKIIFDLDEFKRFLNRFDELIESRVAGGGTYSSEKMVYEVDDYGRIYSKRYINDNLNESKFEEFIQGQIISDLKQPKVIDHAREKS
jgi:hypothetical protein